MTSKHATAPLRLAVVAGAALLLACAPHAAAQDDSSGGDEAGRDAAIGSVVGFIILCLLIWACCRCCCGSRTTIVHNNSSAAASASSSTAQHTSINVLAPPQASPISRAPLLAAGAQCFCCKCGSSMPLHAAFCASCGARTGGGPEARRESSPAAAPLGTSRPDAPPQPEAAGGGEGESDSLLQ